MVICGDQLAVRPPRRCLGSSATRLLQHLLVELEADLLDVAGLFLAEQVAGTADVEVVAAKLEAGAERIERLQHLQPPVGGAGQLCGWPAA